MTLHELTQKPNRTWARSDGGVKLSVEKTPIITPAKKIFAMGSCFASEIRFILKKHGFDVTPRYTEIGFDRAVHVLCDLPFRDNIEYYDTFVIRQEFEVALGERQSGPKDFWVHRDQKINRTLGWEEVWQNPNRKFLLGRSLEDLTALNDRYTDVMKTAIHGSEVFLITLGMTEVWQNETTGGWVILPPFNSRVPGTGDHKVNGLFTRYNQNYDNIRKICEMILGRYPDRHIVLTTSPVGLAATFRGIDVVVANMESKSILRAVAGAASSLHPNIHYFPSYEMIMANRLFQEDGRHVLREGVKSVVDMFKDYYMDGDSIEMLKKEPEDYDQAHAHQRQLAF